jgi:hypothetical protein
MNVMSEGVTSEVQVERLLQSVEEVNRHALWTPPRLFRTMDCTAPKMATN